MIPVYNDGDIISEVLEHLHSQGKELVVLDNGSTDNTVEICKKFSEKGLIHFVQFKSEKWHKDLVFRMLYHIALTQAPDWLILCASDEILESGVSNLTLKEAIKKADTEGYNLIQFDWFNFYLTDNENQSATSTKEKMPYYSWEADHVFRAWKYIPGIIMEETKGHYPIFPEEKGYKIFPKKFVLRHYKIRNATTAMEKIRNLHKRLEGLTGTERYEKFLSGQVPIVKNHKQLTKYEEDNNWNRERKFSQNPKTPPSLNDFFTSTGALKIKLNSISQLKLKLKETREKILNMQKKLDGVKNHK